MLLLILPLVLATAAQVVPAAQTAPPQTPPATAQIQRPSPPPLYNPTADAKAQIAAALKIAKEDGIRVLINWGANDDESSKRFAAARRSGDLATLFSVEYKVVNVDIGHLDKNLDIAKSYGMTLTTDSLPALAVLDAEGNVLARTSGAAFRSDADPAAYDATKLAAFLTKHQAPPAPDAEPLLDAALKQAKTEGKSVFVWFSAPW